MIEIADASINNLASSVMQTKVQPKEEETIFVLTSAQLQEIIARAVQPLQDELDTLREEIAFERARDRQRLAKLEKVEPQPLQKDRAEILRALLAANNGKMLAKDARQKMHLIKPRFSELLATMKEEIEIRPYHLRRNQKILVLK